jgi:hypothetical protein
MNPKLNMEGAEAIIGKHVVIDVEVLDHDETFVERRELHGTIERVSESEGIVVILYPSAHEYILPADLDALQPLAAGAYRLETTGEVIDHPDLKRSLTVHLPPPEFEGPAR